MSYVCKFTHVIHKEWKSSCGFCWLIPFLRVTDLYEVRTCSWFTFCVVTTYDGIITLLLSEICVHSSSIKSDRHMSYRKYRTLWTEFKILRVYNLRIQEATNIAFVYSTTLSLRVSRKSISSSACCTWRNVNFLIRVSSTLPMDHPCCSYLDFSLSPARMRISLSYSLSSPVVVVIRCVQSSSRFKSDVHLCLFRCYKGASFAHRC